MPYELENLIEEARRIEKSRMEYAFYVADNKVEKLVDLEPLDYAELTYGDLINIYERTEKIIKTSSMAWAPFAARPSTKQQSQEIETKLRQMTTETLEKVDTLSREREKPIEIVIPSKLSQDEKLSALDLEFEGNKNEKPPHSEIEIGERITKDSEVKKEEHADTNLEPPLAELTEKEKPREPHQKLETQILEEKPVFIESQDRTPKVLQRETQELHLENKELIQNAVNILTDELSLKKRMLELTKELFKEKSANRREQIKYEITLIKKKISGEEVTKDNEGGRREESKIEGTEKSKRSVGKEVEDGKYDEYRKKIDNIKSNFERDLKTTQTQSQKKQLFEKFMGAITSLVNELQSENFDAKIKIDLAKEIDRTIDQASSTMENMKIQEQQEGENEVQALDEVLEKDDEYCLQYLKVNEGITYRRYQKNLITKADAIKRAKALFAKKKSKSIRKDKEG